VSKYNTRCFNKISEISDLSREKSLKLMHSNERK